MRLDPLGYRNVLNNGLPSFEIVLDEFGISEIFVDLHNLPDRAHHAGFDYLKVAS